MKVKILKLHDLAVVPEYKHDGDSGLDLYSIEEQILQPGDVKLIQTGIAIELPEGTEAQIRPRSGLALKHSVTVLNTPGTVDASYRGEIGVILINHGKNPFHVQQGMRIAQMVITPVIKAEIEQVNSLDETTRGSGGFGSTGV
jgi:dUTP pyrophosphatase